MQNQNENPKQIDSEMKLYEHVLKQRPDISKVKGVKKMSLKETQELASKLDKRKTKKKAKDKKDDIK